MGIDTGLCVGEVIEDLICSICSDVLEDAKEIKKCEHVYCSICVLEWLEVGKRFSITFRVLF